MITGSTQQINHERLYMKKMDDESNMLSTLQEDV